MMDHGKENTREEILNGYVLVDFKSLFVDGRYIAFSFLNTGALNISGQMNCFWPVDGCLKNREHIYIHQQSC